MTVTPLRPPPPRFRPFMSTVDESALTISLTVTLDGDERYADAIEVLDALRRVTERFSSATVALTGAPKVTTADHNSTPAELEPAIEILVGSRSVRAAGAEVVLTRVEFDLLLFLAEHPRRVFTRPQLLQNVWGFSHAGSRTVDVHIRRLRAKLGEQIVTTVRGVGYRLADEANLRVIPL